MATPNKGPKAGAGPNSTSKILSSNVKANQGPSGSKNVSTRAMSTSAQNARKGGGRGR
ncbi:MAG: hypothetical protein NTV94_06485 [Planctomycetota bacterium]|jgi:hypothetical protein|nr:hypothetical protein [Planctomycetota bacterium]